VAGVFAGLTRLPLKERVPPAHALAFVEAVAQRATLLAVPPEATLPLLASLASNGWGGEAVEDALTALVAARAKIDLLLTLDVEGFRRVWPSGAERIRSPRDQT
jgi:predicted nucleic acid-binding protein